MPTPETVNKVLAEIGKSAANYRYFFDKLTSLVWLTPLAEKDLFKNPPEKQEVEGGVIFPGWPASQYLVRMARDPVAAQQVLTIVLAMRETDNIQVNGDLLEIALALPAHDAARLAGRVKNWVQTPYHSTVKHKIGDLIEHLANGSEIEAALQVARDAFALHPQAPVSESEADWVSSPEPQSWLEDWHYSEALTKAIPALVSTDRRRAFEMVCGLLTRAVELSRRKNDTAKQDYSYIWHAAIENDEHPPGLRNSLISTVRDAATSIIDSNQADILMVLETLRRHEWPVFRRIELHLLCRFADNALPEVTKIAPTLVELDASTKHEAAVLLKTAFNRLPKETQEDVLRRIDQGPEEADVIEWLEFLRVPATDEEVARFGRRWRAERYALILDHVPTEWRERVQSILDTAGVVRQATEVDRTETWIGPTSPKTRDEIAAMEPTDVLAFLRDWTPTPGPYEDTPEGLGRILSDVIGQDPNGYVAIVDEFRDVDPTFVRFFFSGLETALKASRSFTWVGVLALAEWVVVQTREISGRRKALMEADPNWAWTRGTIASMLELGLQGRTTEVAYEHRDLVWRILAPLTDDPDPTIEREAKYGGNNMDPPTIAINSVRGKAFNALVGYALWVRRHLDKRDPRPLSSFDVIPEVRDILNRHLDLVQEPTLAIRSAYGRHFPWLHLLDPAWASEAIEEIFPSAEEQAIYFSAAWNAYLSFCPAYDVVLPALRSVYDHGIARLVMGKPIVRTVHHPHQRLAEHIVTFYWRGTIRLDDSLVVAFYRTAPESIRAKAMEYIGRSLVNAPDTIAPEILQRLRALWEERLADAQQNNFRVHRDEIAKFGWWFASRKFDDEWSLHQLLTILDATRSIDPDFKVSEALETLAPRFPHETVRCVTRIVEGDTNNWHTYGNRDHFKEVLRAALVSTDVDTKRAAERLIDLLVGRGHFEFRELIT